MLERQLERMAINAKTEAVFCTARTAEEVARKAKIMGKKYARITTLHEFDGRCVRVEFSRYPEALPARSSQLLRCRE